MCIKSLKPFGFMVNNKSLKGHRLPIQDLGSVKDKSMKVKSLFKKKNPHGKKVKVRDT